jgi:hypothetical protein
MRVETAEALWWVDDGRFFFREANCQAFWATLTQISGDLNGFLNFQVLQSSKTHLFAGTLSSKL